MKSRVVSLVLLVLSLSARAFAQNPCTDPNPPTTGALKMYVQFTDFTALDGTVPVVSGVKMASFLQGVDPNTGAPVQGPTPLQKTDFTLVTGTPDCYASGATVNGLIASVPVSLTQQYVTALKEVGTNGLESPWAVSNPFSRLPRSPVAPGVIRVIR